MKPFTLSDLSAPIALTNPIVKAAREFMTREQRIVLAMIATGGTPRSIAERLHVTRYAIQDMLALVIRKINWVASKGHKRGIPEPVKIKGRPGPKPKKRPPSIEKFNEALQRLRASNSTPQQDESIGTFLSRTLPQAIPENLSVTYDKKGNVLSVTLTYSSPHRSKP